jgi:hypothetical protein
LYSPYIIAMMKSGRVGWVGTCGMCGGGGECTQGSGGLTLRKETTWSIKT